MNPLILIVDDEKDSREALKRTLKSHFEILEAASAADALELLKHHPEVTIVLSDERMPDRSGTELLSQVKTLYPKVIRVIISGQMDLEKMMDAINKAEIHRFIMKPWENHILILQLHEALLHHKDLSQILTLQTLAITDPVTGLTNHRFFQERINEELERSLRHKRVFSLIMIDIDHFKKFNDQYGHPEGDKALAKIAQLIKTATRTADSLSRYGGEEFAMILPETNKLAAKDVAERIRKDLENAAICGDEACFNMTLSLGVASFPEDGKSAAEIINRADQALYTAKKNGRDRVEIA